MWTVAGWLAILGAAIRVGNALTTPIRPLPGVQRIAGAADVITDAVSWTPGDGTAWVVDVAPVGRVLSVAATATTLLLLGIVCLRLGRHGPAKGRTLIERATTRLGLSGGIALILLGAVPDLVRVVANNTVLSMAGLAGQLQAMPWSPDLVVILVGVLVAWSQPPALLPARAPGAPPPARARRP